MTLTREQLDELERLEKAARTKIQVGPDGCWRWTAACDPEGYGRLRGKLAHRSIYRMLVGPIPDGLTLDHLCRNRRCVNPNHLEPVTQRINTLRGTGFAAEQARRTHCSKCGLPLAGGNLISREGHRRCRACARARGRRRYKTTEARAARAAYFRARRAKGSV